MNFTLQSRLQTFIVNKVNSVGNNTGNMAGNLIGLLLGFQTISNMPVFKVQDRLIVFTTVKE